MAVDDVRENLAGWQGAQLTDDSRLYDTKNYVNFLLNAVQGLSSQSLVISPVTLTSASDWNTVQDNTVNYVSGFGNGSPLFNDFGTDQGYLFNISGIKGTILKLQVLLGDNGRVALRSTTTAFNAQHWNILESDDQLQENASKFVQQEMKNYALITDVNNQVGQVSTDSANKLEVVRQDLVTKLTDLSSSLALYYTKEDIDKLMQNNTLVQSALFLTPDQRTNFRAKISEAEGK